MGDDYSVLGQGPIKKTAPMPEGTFGQAAAGLVEIAKTLAHSRCTDPLDVPCRTENIATAGSQCCSSSCSASSGQLMDGTNQMKL